MKTKWITADSATEIERLANEFDEQHSVKFSQTHATYNLTMQKMVYTMVLFYED